MTVLPSKKSMPREKGGQPVRNSSHMRAARADARQRMAVMKCARTANRKRGISRCIMSVADRANALWLFPRSVTMASEAAKTLTKALHRAAPAIKIKSRLTPPMSGVSSPGLMGTANRTLSAITHRSAAGVRSEVKKVMAASVCMANVVARWPGAAKKCLAGGGGGGSGGGTKVPPGMLLGTRPAGRCAGARVGASGDRSHVHANAFPHAFLLATIHLHVHIDMCTMHLQTQARATGCRAGHTRWPALHPVARARTNSLTFRSLDERELLTKEDHTGHPPTALSLL